jgi:DNA invertase Pin-like site-specific DNA recombinase
MDRMQLGAYIRVSKVAGREGDSFLSPRLQRDKITAWATAGGHDIADLREDLDVSGASTDRRQLEELVEAIETGRLNGLVVATLDRFGRSLPYAIGLIDRIDKAGGQFVSVADGFDTSTPYGKLALNIMLSIAQFELERIRVQWRVIVQRQISEGRHPGAMAPFGYQRGGRGVLKPLEPAARTVGEIFALYARGETLSAISRILREQGVRTQLGALPTRRFIHGILTNRVYLGEARSGSLLNETAHPPLVDRHLFDACQTFRPKSPSGPDPALLAGLCRCQGCRYAMAPVMRDGKRRYRCLGNQQGRKCPAPAFVTETELWPLVETAFFSRLGDLVAEAGGDTDELAALTARREDEQRDLVEFRDNIELQRALGTQGFVEGVQVRQAALDITDSEIRRAVAARPAGLPDAAVLRSEWSAMTSRQRNDLLRLVFDAIVVRKHPSRSTRLAIGDRVRFLPRGTNSDVGGLPRSGRRAAGSIEPFDWASSPPGPWILPG